MDQPQQVVSKQSPRTLFLCGPVDGSNGVPIVNALRRLADESKDDITLFICSPGGRVDSCIGIIDTMAEIDCDVVTITLGGGASAAAAIGCSGTKGKRYVSKNAEIMFHMPRGGWAHNESALKQAAYMKSMMEEILVEASGKSLEDVQDDMRLELYMNAEDAIEYGAYDHIL